MQHFNSIANIAEERKNSAGHREALPHPHEETPASSHPASLCMCSAPVVTELSTTTRTTTTSAAAATSASALRQTPAAAQPTTTQPDKATVSQMRKPMPAIIHAMSSTENLVAGRMYWNDLAEVTHTHIYETIFGSRQE
ncbi:uncharacterized protein LOC126108264 [Schistocerca cancellata]|uniref:uncharacterized protein LOC126108264 n=1 Tax=Schistocerca cancellata TaxID=274614 RepID=UPI0021180D8E|nr:uncharacterized protein LOC126108264 [Schistocerca cancellata]